MVAADGQTIDKIRSAANSVKLQSDGSFMCQCPAHDDNEASLHVTEKSDGTILLKCHAGCSCTKICNAWSIKLSDLFTKQKDLSSDVKAFHKFDYQDKSGNLIFQACRIEYTGGKKKIYQRRPDGNGGWINNTNGITRVPYRLQMVLGSGLEKVVFIVEGEKKADLLISWGFVATCNAGGAGKWLAEYSEYLRDRKVIILPDNDDPGLDHATKVCQSLSGIAKAVRAVRLPGLPTKGDIVDWVEAGNNKQRFIEVVNDRANDIELQPKIKPQGDQHAAVKRLELGTLVRCADRDNIGDVISDYGGDTVSVHFQSPEGQHATIDIPRKDLTFADGRSVTPSRFRLNLIPSKDFATADYKLRYLVKHVLVEGQPCIVGGPRKGLKTGTMIDLAVSLGTATPFLGRAEFAVPERVNVAILSGESGLYTLQETAKRVSLAHQVTLEDATIWWADRLPSIANVDHLDALREEITKQAIKVCVIDPAYLCLLSGDTKGRQASNLFDVGALLMGLVDVGRDTGCGIVLAHHTRKNPAEPFAIPELEELAYAGFAEFARQWILINRRSAYGGGGIHKLWLSIGGSAGHSSTWAYDVEEGVPDEWFRGRYWDVNIRPAGEAIEAARSDRERQKENEQADRKLKNMERIMSYLRKANAPKTKKVIREATSLSSTNFNPAWDEVMERKVLRIVDVKGDNGRTYEGYTLVTGPAG